MVKNEKDKQTNNSTHYTTKNKHYEPHQKLGITQVLSPENCFTEISSCLITLIVQFHCIRCTFR